MKMIIRTSNLNKLAEFRRFGLDVEAEPGADLSEVDGSPDQVIIYKALAAGPGVLVEDTSLDVTGFDAGVNIRWMLDAMTSGSGMVAEPRALWRVMMAYHVDGQLHVAESTVSGKMIAAPRGGGFSFDPYFVPDGYDKTLGELLDIGLKDTVSARKFAVEKLLSGHTKTFAVADIPAWTGGYQQDDAAPVASVTPGL